MTISTVAALQIGSSPKARPARWNACLPSNPRSPRRAGGHARGAAGGYPKGEIFGTRLGYRLPEAARPMRAITTMPSTCRAAETEALASLSQHTGASLVVGVIERGGSTLYCTALYFEPRPAWSPSTAS